MHTKPRRMMHEVCARAMSRGPTICGLLRVVEEEEGEGEERASGLMVGTLV